MPPARFGRYEVQEELGHGGMGAVYRAYDPRFRRTVAVKVLSRQLLSDANFRARFDREARTVAALEHSAIVPVYDYGEEEGEPFLVFRLMEGGNLAERIRAGPLELAEVGRIVERVAKALDHAHARGIIHRDIKPANIMFDGEGEAWLTDFGIARLAEYTASLTGTGIIGSPAYMSPEQWEGKPATAASDIYSLGCTVFEALTGRPPFIAESPLAVGMKHLREEAPRASMVEPRILEACDSAVAESMRKDPAQRPPNARTWAGTLALRVFGRLGDEHPALASHPARVPLPLANCYHGRTVSVVASRFRHVEQPEDFLGEVIVPQLENPIDRELSRRGHLAPAEIRTKTIRMARLRTTR